MPGRRRTRGIGNAISLGSLTHRSDLSIERSCLPSARLPIRRVLPKWPGDTPPVAGPFFCWPESMLPVGIRSRSIQTISTSTRMHFCVGRLEAMRLAISGATDVEHVQSLRRRHGGGA